MEEAARIAVGVVLAHFENPAARLERVIFVLYGKAAYATYQRALEQAMGST
jgi:O-acetyl-ADP-ribose deacetylase (regulator of RNase III)